MQELTQALFPQDFRSTFTSKYMDTTTASSCPLMDSLLTILLEDKGAIISKYGSQGHSLDKADTNSTMIFACFMFHFYCGHGRTDKLVAMRDILTDHIKNNSNSRDNVAQELCNYLYIF